MGFGTLLFGYFAMFAFSISPYYFFADVIGAFVTVYALSKLSEYSRNFGWAMIGALGFLILSGVNAVSILFGLYPMNEGGAWVAVQVLKLAAGCVMHVFLFLGTKTVAERAEQGALAKRSVFCLSAVCLYYAAALIAVPVTPLLPERTGQAVSAGILLYWVFCLIVNLLLLYGCFSHIVPADADMTAKPRSRIGLLNKMSDKFDELDDKKNEYRRESMKLAMEEADRLHEERKRKQGGKGKKKKK